MAARFARRFLIVWAGLFGAWLCFALVVFPALLRSAYADPGFPILGSMLSGRNIHPVERYLDAWRTRAITGTAVLIVLGALGWVCTTTAARTWLRSFFARSSELRLRDVVLLAVWAGLLIGWAEAIARIIAGWVTRRPPAMPGAEILWTTPLVSASLAVLAALALYALTAGWRGVQLRPFVLMFGSLGTYVFIASFRAGIHGLAVAALALGVGVQLSRVAAARRDRVAALFRRTMPVLAGLLIVLIPAVPMLDKVREMRALARLPAAIAGAPNVILIILDTVRAQSLSLYGYVRPTTPQLDQWAERGVTFERPIAPSSWTLPTHSTLFTGRWPNGLGLDRRNHLGPEAPTLAEALAARGYVTAGFVGNLDYASRAAGFDRGFARYEDHPTTVKYALHNSRWARWWVHRGRATSVGSNVGYKVAADINRDFFRWLHDLEDRPFFAFLNYADAHGPRVAHAPFDTLFSGTPPNNPRRQADRYPAERIAEFENAYDEAIAYLDHHIGRLLDELERRGTLSNTVIVITSDHGEHFGEHSLMWHGNSLYMPLVHVPLMIIAPSAPGGTRVREPVSLRDVPATILDLTMGGPPALPGETLRGSWTRTHADTARAVYTELVDRVGAYDADPDEPSSHAPLQSFVVGNLQYIRNADGVEQLFDIAAGPGEESEVRGVERERHLARFRQLFVAQSRSLAAAGRTEFHRGAR